jgi:ABC-type spermidine/putrescine transport system permease subunit I
MGIVVNPYIATAIIGGGIFIVSFLLGRWSIPDRTDEIVENTINYLIKDGYLKSQKNIKGEIELLKLEE